MTRSTSARITNSLMSDVQCSIFNSRFSLSAVLRPLEVSFTVFKGRRRAKKNLKILFGAL